MSTSTQASVAAAQRDEQAKPHYSMVITWDPRDAIFVVTVPELDGCATHGATYEEAARQGQDAIETWVDGALADGLPLPPPREYQRLSAS